MDCWDKTAHLAIIDYLQAWNLNKMSERVLKVGLLGKDADGLSAIDPAAYAKRFLAFMNSYVIKN
jgi:hypothetical protein